MYQNSTKTNYKKILLIGCISLLMIVAIIYKLNKNQGITQNEIRQEQNTVGYAAQATLVKEISFSEAFNYRGTVEAGKIITLSSETDGQIVYSAIEKGRAVSKGSILAKVDQFMRLSSFQISIDTYEKLKNDYAKLKELLTSGNASGVEVENAKLQMLNAASQLNINKKQVGQALILAPESGTIIEKKINQGEYVTPGFQLGTIACLDEVLVNVYVQEDEIAQLKKGAIVNIIADAYPGVQYNGRISAIVPVASEAKTFPVQIKLQNNKPQKLLAGMNVTVTFDEEKKTSALVIPRSAVAGDKNQAIVYLIHHSRQPVAAPVNLGKEYDTYLSVSKGLKAGDTVMTSGLLNVEPGKKIQQLTIKN